MLLQPVAFLKHSLQSVHYYSHVTELNKTNEYITEVNLNQYFFKICTL